MGFISGEFPGHSKSLVNPEYFLKLCYGARSWIKYISTVGAQRIHMSFQYNR